MIEPTKRDEEVYALLLSNRGRVTDLAAYREELLAASAQSAPREIKDLSDTVSFNDGMDDDAQSAEPQEADYDGDGDVIEILDALDMAEKVGVETKNPTPWQFNTLQQVRRAIDSIHRLRARLASKPSRAEADELDATALADTAYGPNGYNPDNEWQNCRDMINHIQWLYHKHAGDSGVDAATEDALASLDQLHKHYAARPSREEEMREQIERIKHDCENALRSSTHHKCDYLSLIQSINDRLARAALAQGDARDEGEGKR
jgi:hypothetical protein